MKRMLILIFFIGLFVSCDKDECSQDALCTKVTNGLTSKSVNEKVTLCHNGNTIEVNENAVQSHIDHGDTLGECETLSSGGLVFKDGAVVSIPCKYNLPLIHVDDNGARWLYEEQ